MPPTIIENVAMPLYELEPIRIPHSVVVEMVTKKALEEAEQAVSASQGTDIDITLLIHYLKIAREFYYRGDFKRSMRFVGKVFRSLG